MGAEGPSRRGIRNVDNVAAIPVASQAVVYSKAMDLIFGQFFGLRYRGQSTPNLKIEVEQSDQLPAVEGEADVNYVVPSGMTAVETALTATTWKIKSLPLVPQKYMRLKITGNSGNGAGATLQSYLTVQEDYS